jgi:hypothetical protein
MISRFFLKLIESGEIMSQTHSVIPTPEQQKAFFQFATGLSVLALAAGVAVASYIDKNPFVPLATFGTVTTAFAVCAHRAGRDGR